MTTGYQIYVRRNHGEIFRTAGLNNWFWNLADAIERKEALEKTWGEYGREYIIVDCAAN